MEKDSEVFCQDTRANSQGYGKLLQQFAIRTHQSCLLLASREMPPEIKLLQDRALPVLLMQLKGLELEEGQTILTTTASLKGSTEDWQKLIERYGGNPLALKIASKTIETWFDGGIEGFLQYNTTVFGHIRQLIEEQLHRLSEVAQQMIDWLALYPEQVSLPKLALSLEDSPSTAKLLAEFQSLQGRSLVELEDSKFVLQPLVREYLREKLIDKKIST